MECFEVLTQELHGVVVLPQALVSIPLVPEPGSRTGGMNLWLHHPESVDLAAQNALSDIFLEAQ